MQNSNKFKLVLSVIFGFFILIGLIAFSTYRSSNPANTAATINIWGTVDKTIFDSYLTKYKQDNSLQFNLAYTFKSLDTIDASLVEAIATGKAPDAILIPQTLEKRYLDKVYLITAINARDFQDTFIQESDLYMQPGGMFAIPFFVDPLVMYWNKDTFSSAGIATPPTQWTQFPQLAQKLSESDNSSTIKKSAVALGEFQNINNAKAILSTLIMQAGSPIVSENNGVFRSALSSKSATDVLIPANSALQFYTDYSNPQKVVYSWNRSLPSSKSFFLSEDLAMYFGFASEIKDIKDKNPNLNFDIAMVPQVIGGKSKITYGNIYGFSILKSSQNVNDTYGIISLLTGANSVSTLTQYMNVAPARLDLISAGTPDPIKTVFNNSALISKGWIDPDMKQTDKIFKDMIENVTSGKSDVEGSVSDASSKLDNLL